MSLDAPIVVSLIQCKSRCFKIHGMPKVPIRRLTLGPYVACPLRALLKKQQKAFKPSNQFNIHPTDEFILFPTTKIVCLSIITCSILLARNHSFIVPTNQTLPTQKTLLRGRNKDKISTCNENGEVCAHLWKSRYHHHSDLPHLSTKKRNSSKGPLGFIHLWSPWNPIYLLKESWGEGEPKKKSQLPAPPVVFLFRKYMKISQFGCSS